MDTVLIDRTGDARTPAGYSVIETEVAFLQKATSSGRWLIRGKRLCDWAEAFLTGRKIDWQEAQSPTAGLQAAIPGLSCEQAAEFIARLGSRFDRLPWPPVLSTLANALYPSRLWSASPGREHAAEWLLWLDSHSDLTGADRQLLLAIAQQWRYQSPEEWENLYEVVAPEKAREILEQWLTGSELSRELGAFPIDLPPEWIQRVKTRWRSQLVETQGAFLETVVIHTLSSQLKEALGDVAHTYFKEKPAHLTEHRLACLSPLMGRARWQELRGLVAPPVPTPCPDLPEAVLAWFRNEYLPFREWQERTNDKHARGLVLELARQFAKWYLDFYPAALVSSSTSGCLSFFKLERPREEHRHVTLLVVLDGLHVADARTFLQRLQLKTDRLSERRNEVAFTAIPTVTVFAKEALLKGVPPRDSANVAYLGEDLPERESPLNCLEAANPGEVFIWRFQEPDYTYHGRNRHKMLEREVEGQLQTVADKVVEVVNQLSGNVPLRIIVTSDHGRLLATASRNVRVPYEMQAHGRAAWGNTGRSFDSSGYTIEDNLAFIYGERFGLPEDVAIILDESAFLTNDGKQGSERYPHGGLFPEEVIVPWLELERDAMPAQAFDHGVHVTVTGKARAGQAGVLEIAVTNPTEVPLVLAEIRLSFGNKRSMEIVNVEGEIPALTEHRIMSNLAVWPSRNELRHASGSAAIEWPTGEFLNIDVTLDLDSEELYWRDTSLLEDLGLE